MSDLSKRRPQIDFCAGYRAHKRGDPREGCSAAWHEGWDAHAELAAERERTEGYRLSYLNSFGKVAKLREALVKARPIIATVRDVTGNLEWLDEAKQALAAIDAVLKEMGDEDE